MESRYSYMWEANTKDDDGDGDFWPDPLSIDYDPPLDATKTLPEGYTLKNSDMKKLWLAYYRATSATERDDIMYQINDIPNVGMLEPGDVIYLFNTREVAQYTFANLKDD